MKVFATLIGLLVLAGCATPIPPQSASEMERLIDQQLATISPGTQGQKEAFLLVVSGFDEPEMFSNEMHLAAKQLGVALNAQSRTLLMSNSVKDGKSLPQVTPITLNYAIELLAKKMNVDEDLLAIYIVSHGAPEKGIVLHRADKEKALISPEWLTQTLNYSNVKWRMAIISACYSGQFIVDLKTSQTMIMTAADAKHPSFGCHASNTYTYFGRELLVDRDYAQPDWSAIYTDTVKRVSDRETRMMLEGSNPQFWLGDELAKYLTTFPKATQMSQQ